MAADRELDLAKARLCELDAWNSDSVERFVSHLAITNDSHWIAIADREHHIKLLDRREGDRLRALCGHADDIRGLKFSEDGRSLASHSADGTVRLWHCDTGSSILCLLLAEDSNPEACYFFSEHYFLVNAGNGLQIAFDIDAAEFCTKPDIVCELFANQTSSANSEKVDRALLGTSLSEQFEFAKAAHGIQTLAMQFQRLPNLTATTWFCEFSEPPQLLRLESHGVSCAIP